MFVGSVVPQRPSIRLRNRCSLPSDFDNPLEALKLQTGSGRLRLLVPIPASADRTARSSSGCFQVIDQLLEDQQTINFNMVAKAVHVTRANCSVSTMLWLYRTIQLTGKYRQRYSEKKPGAYSASSMLLTPPRWSLSYRRKLRYPNPE